MNNGSVNLLGVVALTVDLPQDNLWRSQPTEAYQQLQRSMDQLAAEAEQKGLIPEILESILNNE